MTKRPRLNECVVVLCFVCAVVDGMCVQSCADTITLAGTVLGKDGKAVTSAVVKVVNTNYDFVPSQITKDDGAFSFNIPKSSRMQLVVILADGTMVPVENLSGHRDQHINVTIPFEGGFQFAFNLTNPSQVIDRLFRVMRVRKKESDIDTILATRLKSEAVKQCVLRSTRSEADRRELERELDALRDR